MVGRRLPEVMVRALIKISTLAALLLTSALYAAPQPAGLPVGPDHKIQVYRLDTVEIAGSSRMTAQKLATELGLTPGILLNDELVMSTRARLLGLGLFKSAILIMRRGSIPGTAKLVVEVEDDPSVLGDWAMGGELDVAVADRDLRAADPNMAPLDYRLGLVGRNIFGALHRGTAMADIDSKGSLRQAHIAYGLPRFAHEGVQFDTELALVNPAYRYLDTLGFGAHGQSLWSRTVANLGEVQYGAAMYVNKRPNYYLPGFPTAVAGPKIALFKETRLHGFFPGEGYLLAPSLVLAPVDTHFSLFELDMARTFALRKWLYLTMDMRGMAVGLQGYAVRGEGRIDVPLSHARPEEDQAEVFLRLRGGRDELAQTSLTGTEAVFGVRYHSSGFIAELAVQVTRSPQQLTVKKTIDPPPASWPGGIP